MGIMCNVLDISEKASDALILALTPSEALSDSQRAEKIANIESRNRVMRELEKQCRNLPDPEQAAALLHKIESVKNFFNQIGNAEEESKIANLTLRHFIQKSIEAPIPGSILLASKPDQVCKPNEIKEKQKQREMRDEILKITIEKAKNSKVVFENLKKLFHCLDYQSTVELA